MENDHNTNIAIIITIVVIAIFFGGWYIYFGQAFNQPTSKEPITNTVPQKLPIQ